MRPYRQQTEAVSVALREHRGGIVMPTGAGKSVTMALLINALQVRTLVVVPNLELKRQLSETFLTLFGSLSNITVENIDSPRLKTETDYDLLLIDECHRSASATYQKLNKTAWSGIYWRFFFTATFFRNQDEEQLRFEGICGRIIYQLSYKTAVANKLIVPLEAYYVEIPAKKTDGVTWSQVYADLVVNNEPRNHIIAKLLLSLSLSGSTPLCLVKEIHHGNLLAELTGCHFANGQDENSKTFIQKFSRGELPSLIGTTGVVGEGSDTKSCEFVIIAGLGKAKSAFQQQIGRCLRTYQGKTSGKVIIIKDKSHKFLTRHFKAQCDILKQEYGIVPIKLDV